MAGKKKVEDTPLTLEENFARLEETIERLEDEDISLEEVILQMLFIHINIIHHQAILVIIFLSH